AIVLDDAEVDALEAADASALAQALLAQDGAIDGALAQQIAAESHGVPLFIQELVRHTARGGENREVSLNEALSRRIAVLPKNAGALLEVLAASSGPIPQRIAFRAAGLAQGQEAALHTLRVAGLARSRGAKAEDSVETTHDRIRQVVRSRLDTEGIAHVHARLLEAFEHETVHDDERLFTHSLGAGQKEPALAHAERAAERARDALAFHRAIELYRVALELAEQVAPDDRARRARVRRGLGDALSALGHHLDAAREYELASTLADEHAERLEAMACDQFLRGGDIQRGSELLRVALERVGVTYPKSPRAALAALAFERARLFTRGLSFEPRAPEQISQRELTLLDALKLALGVYWLVEPVRGALFATLYLRHALETGHPRHVLRGLEVEAAYVALTGGAKGEARSGELYASARALAHRTGSAGALGGYKLAEAGFHAIYGRKQKSSECAQEALTTLKHYGFSWERSYAHFHLYQNTLYLGGRDALAEEVEEHVHDAEQRRDRFGAAILLPMVALARMMSDEPAAAHAAMTRMRPLLSDEVFSFLDMQEMIWTALAHQYTGDPRAALAHYELQAERYGSSGMPRLSTWRLLHQWGSMLAHVGALAQGYERERNTRAAEERIKQIERERIDWPLAFASAGRAALHHAAGDVLERDRALARAIVQAETLGYAPFAALYARSAAYFARDEEALARHETALRGLGIRNPQRWQRVWAPGLG
ncbi:MAG TPA: hypothetical protein VI299_20470, partial [Polyangiales bacterium]